MNTFKLYFFAIVVSLIWFCPLVAFGAPSEAPLHAYTAEALKESDVRDRVNDLDIAIDVKFNKKVKAYIDSYVLDYRIGTERLLGRSELYFPIIDQEISKRGLPNELKFLAVIESSLIPDARSRVGAVGMWQFMRRTGQHYGLQVSHTVDQRKDPISSTKAALSYLEDLYNRFGNWTLAIAAYNCGPGNMNKAIRKANSKDYWVLEKFLPRETRNYVPKFIAAAYLMNYYYLHDFSPEHPEHINGNTAAAKIFNKISFKELSEITGFDLEHIKTLNPGYLNNIIPSSHNGMFLMLPTESMYTFLASAGRSADIEFGQLKWNPDGSLSAMVNEGLQVSSRDILVIDYLPLLENKLDEQSCDPIFNHQNDMLYAFDNDKKPQEKLSVYRSRKQRNRF